MRVGLVILHADPARGGAERYTVDLAAALAARHHEVTVLSATARSLPAGVSWQPLAYSGWTRTAKLRSFQQSYLDQISRTPYDVVHAALPMPRCDIYHPHAGVAAEQIHAGHLKYRGWRRRWAQLNNQWNSRRQLMAQTELSMLSDPNPPVVLALSQRISHAIEQYYSLAADRQSPLFNAIRLEQFDPQQHAAAADILRERWTSSRNERIALFMSQDFERKNLSTAIEMLTHPAAAGWRLVVVGRPDPTRWQQEAQRLGVTDRVTFAGPTREPGPCYAAADLLVFPSLSDTCPLVVLEALVMGLPVAISGEVGARDTLIDGVHGRVIDDPRDAAGFARALAEFADPNRWHQAHNACLALRPQLSYDDHLQRLEQVYQEVVLRKRGPLPAGTVPPPPHCDFRPTVNPSRLDSRPFDSSANSTSAELPGSGLVQRGRLSSILPQLPTSPHAAPM